jgi:hypothetical protein
MNILIACEFSGMVRDAFRAKGFNAISCDLIQTEAVGPHYLGDIRDILSGGWDMMIAHPPCTYLSSSGARWWSQKQNEQRDAVAFVQLLMDAPIARIAIENPIGKLSTSIRKPDQIVQPWQFGHPETKATCFWLKNLPLLKPTLIVLGREPRVHRESESPERWKNRSRTLKGLAEAMVTQWGYL